MLICNDLQVTLGKKQILKDVSFSVPRGSFTAILGKNGSGKTTLANCIFGQAPWMGEMLLNGSPIQTLDRITLARTAAFLPQAVPQPDITAAELVAFGRNPHMGRSRYFTGEDKQQITRAMALTGTAEFAGRDLRTLSGGERQKVYLAMCLAQQTPLLVLDEPTTYMDIDAQAAFMRLLRSLTQQGKTLIVVLHDLSQAVKYADRLVVLSGGSCVFSGSTQSCLAQGVIESVFGVRRLTVPTDTGEEILFAAK